MARFVKLTTRPLSSSPARPVMVNLDLITVIKAKSESDPNAGTSIHFDKDNYLNVLESLDEIETLLNAN